MTGRAENCSGLPTSFSGGEFPTGDFFTNFNNDCYTVKLGSGVGAVEYGDLNAKYYQLYYQVDPSYELILVGSFPNARYFSVTLYDAHSALSQTILDTNITPLTSQYINPYQPGVAYVSGQQFAIPIKFGGQPGKLETGCEMQGYNVDMNGLDATQRHPGMDWNDDAGFFQANPGFRTHDIDNPSHSNPNTAGVLMIRAYMDQTPVSYDTTPHVIVRDVASGCAYPSAYVTGTLGIVVDQSSQGSAWLDQTQFEGHHVYEAEYLPKLCYAGPPSPDHLRWARQPEYIPAQNPDASYMVAPLPANLPTTLAQAGEVMRIRVRIPTTPPVPCTDGCSRSGNEQMRYMSLSFVPPTGSTIASLDDTAFTTDPNGYATLIVGTGATIPSWITPANGYTFLDLTELNNYQQLSLLDLRHIIPSPGFACAGQYVPYNDDVDTPAGSLLGDYLPVVDYPVASTLPQTATPLVSASACGSLPAGVPGVRPACAVLPEPLQLISSFVTQCPAPGCTQFVAQPNPPITITGAGFGAFPEGLPFSGTTSYLRLLNSTQHWFAGYTGDKCTVNILSWSDTMIQLVANIGQKGGCPVSPGDAVHVQLWNPQSNALITASVTAAEPTNGARLP